MSEHNHNNHIPTSGETQEVGEDLHIARTTLDTIRQEVGGEPVEVDRAVADYTRDSEGQMLDGSKDEIVAAETAGLQIISSPSSSPNTAKALDSVPIESLGPALAALEAGEGQEAANLVMGTLDAVAHDAPPDNHEHHPAVDAQLARMGDAAPGTHVEILHSSGARSETGASREKRELSPESIAKLEAAERKICDPYFNGELPQLSLEEIRSEPGQMLLARARDFRNIESNYRYNNPGAIRIDEVIKDVLTDPTRFTVEQVAMAEGFISDRPENERRLMGWITGEGAEEEALVTKVVDIARRREEVAKAAYDNYDRMSALSSSLGMSEAQLTAELWEKSGDRLYALDMAEQVASSDAPGHMKSYIGHIMTEDYSTRTDYARSFMADVENGTVQKLHEITDITKVNLEDEYLQLLRSSNEKKIKTLGDNALHPKTAEVLGLFAQMGDTLTDDPASIRKEVLERYFFSDFSQETIAEKHASAISTIIAQPEDVQILSSNELLARQQQDILAAVFDSNEPLTCIKGMGNIFGGGFVKEILDSNHHLSVRMLQDFISHPEFMAEIAADLSQCDKSMRDYISKHLQLPGFVERPIATLQTIREFRLPEDRNDAVCSNRAREVIASLIERDGVDKLLSSETKLRQLILDEDLLQLYMDVYKAKKDGSDIESVFEASQGNRDDIAQIKNLRPDQDTPHLLGRLQEVVVKHNKTQQARARWLKEYGSQDIRSSDLANAWSHRREALDNGIADSPGAILRWAQEVGFKKYIEKLRSEPYVRELPTADEVESHGELIKALAGRYTSEMSLGALNRILRDERDGLLERSELTPGRVEVEVDGAVYTVEVLDKTDPRGFTIGPDTGCCMTLGGASESCIWAGYEDSRYGFMAVYKDGRLRAQSLLYVDGVDDGGQALSDTLVVDNIEANMGSDFKTITEVYQRGIPEFLTKGALTARIRQVHLGEGRTDADFSNLPVAETIVKSPRRGVYSDADRQRVLLTN